MKKKTEKPYETLEELLERLRLNVLTTEQVVDDAVQQIEERFRFLVRCIPFRKIEGADPTIYKKFFTDLTRYAQTGDPRAVDRATMIACKWLSWAPKHVTNALLWDSLKELFPEYDLSSHDRVRIPVTPVEVVIWTAKAREQLDDKYFKGIDLWLLALLGSSSRTTNEIDPSLLELPFEKESRSIHDPAYRYVQRGAARRWLAKRQVPGYGRSKRAKLRVVK